MWVTGDQQGRVVLSVGPERIEQTFTVNDVTSNNPIVAGPDGQMWVAASEKVVHFSPSDPERRDRSRSRI